MSHGRGKLTACASVALIGGAFYLTSTDRVASQPVSPSRAAPAPAVAPAAQAGLRADQIQLIARTLAEAESHGFRSGQFGEGEIQRLVAAGDTAGLQRVEPQLRRSLLAYARAQRSGLTPASAFPEDWGLKPATYNAEPEFAFALSQNKLAEWLASLPPPFERYRTLRTALGRYKAIAAEGGWQAIGPGPVLKPGMTDPRVVALRHRIEAETPHLVTNLDSPVYDQALAAAVAATQARYGLPDDGVIGAGTLAALNKPVEARIAQISANMERWRWMPRVWPRTRIEVNIPSAELKVFDDNTVIEDMRVAVGKRTNRTPMLVSEIHSVVLNPAWNVPTSIASKELVPKGGGYLARNGFRWVSDGAGGSRLQQRPGPGNSLGRIKFDFQNPYGVYLHDTNAKAVFERDARSVSHGCVRVERPMDLARVLLERRSRWDAARLEAALDDTETVRASLEQRWPVMILYWTALADAQGQVNFRDDVYGWDEQLLQLIGGGGMSA